MPFPFVSRSVYDDLQRRYDALFAKYDALKVAGAVPVPPRAPPAGPSPEAIAAKKLHDDLVGRLAADIQTMPGVRGDDAKAEARRLRAEAFGGDGVP